MDFESLDPRLKNTSGLFFVVDKRTFYKKAFILEKWVQHVVKEDGYQIETPNLLPKQVLKNSGHYKNFEASEIFELKNTELCLRPQTTQSIFLNLKKLRRLFKGTPLIFWQKGSSFRNEKTSRRKKERMIEFEQIELVCLAKKGYSFFETYLPRIANFFKSLDLKVKFKELLEDKPHYSLKTIDLIVGPLEIGCINDRGDNDLWAFSEKEKAQYNLFEISLGLSRLLQIIR